MTQDEFMKSLEESLKARKVANVQDILQDYKEHFAHGLKKGKSENEISGKLGHPRNIAMAYETESLIKTVKSPDTKFQWNTAFRVIGRLAVLTPFNILVLLIPGLAFFSIVISGWAISVTFAGVSMLVLAIGITANLINLSIWSSVALGSASMGLLGLAFLIGIVMFVLTKYLLLGLISYLRWNANFVLEK